MNLFNNYGFMRAFTRYLMKEIDNVDFFGEDVEQKEFFQTLNSTLEEYEKKPIETLNKCIEQIAKSKCAHIAHCVAFVHLKQELENITEEDFYNLYAVLFEIFEHQEMSFPACQVLYDYFHLIVCDIKRDNNCSLTFESESDIRCFENEVYRVLAQYVIEKVDMKDLTIWGEDYDYGLEDISTVTEGKPFEEYEKLNCYVHIADQETVNRCKRASYLPGYVSTDIDGGIFLIENMITITNKDFKDAVTFQIIGHKRFDSYKEMYEELGTDSFGYINESPESCAQNTEFFFSKYDPEGVLALKVRKINMWVLNKMKYMALQDYEKMKKDKNDENFEREYLCKKGFSERSFKREHSKFLKKRRIVESKKTNEIFEIVLATEHALFDFRKKMNISLNLRLKSKLIQQGADLIPIEILYDEYIIHSLEKMKIEKIVKQIEESLNARIIIIDGDFKKAFVHTDEEQELKKIIQMLLKKHTIVWL